MPPKKIRLTQPKNKRDAFTWRRSQERKNKALLIAANQPAVEGALHVPEVKCEPLDIWYKEAKYHPPVLLPLAVEGGSDAGEDVMEEDIALAQETVELVVTTVPEIKCESLDIWEEEAELHPPAGEEEAILFPPAGGGGGDAGEDVLGKNSTLAQDAADPLVRPVFVSVETINFNDIEKGKVHFGSRTVGVNANIKPSTRNSAVQTKKKTHHVRSKEVQVKPYTVNVGVTTDIQYTGIDVDTQTCFEDIPVGRGNFLQVLSNALKNVLSSAWSVSSRNDTLHIAMIDIHPRPVILKSILLLNNEIRISVLGQPLMNNHQLWDIAKEFSIPAIGEEHSASDPLNILKTLAEEIESLKVCDGCQKDGEVWHQGIFSKRGYVDKFYSETPVYRSNGCHLLLYHGSACLACRTEQTNMGRQVKRRQRRALMPRDLSKINHKYRSWHEPYPCTNKSKKAYNHTEKSKSPSPMECKRSQTSDEAEASHQTVTKVVDPMMEMSKDDSLVDKSLITSKADPKPCD